MTEIDELVRNADSYTEIVRGAATSRCHRRNASPWSPAWTRG